MSKKQIILFDLSILLLFIISVVIAAAIPTALTILFTDSTLAKYSFDLCCLSVFVFYCIWIKLSRNMLENYLYVKLDANAFYDICMNSLFLRYVYYGSAYFYTGRYQETVNICVENIRKSRKSNWKYYNTLFCTYFILGDYDKLIELRKWAPQPKKLKNKPIYMGPLLEGDYEAAKQALLGYMNNNSSEPAKSFDYFVYGVICCKLEQLDEAKTYFKMIVDKYPNLGISKQAKEYLTAIDFGMPLPTYSEILPENTKHIKVGKIKARTFIANIFYVLLFFAGTYFLMNLALLTYYFVQF